LIPMTYISNEINSGFSLNIGRLLPIFLSQVIPFVKFFLSSMPVHPLFHCRVIIPLNVKVGYAAITRTGNKWDLRNLFFNRYLDRFWGYSDLIRIVTLSNNCL
jgi:hypothetical protein